LNLGVCQCLAAPMTVAPTGHANACQAKTECLGFNGSDYFFAQCACGYTNAGTKYCNPHLGDYTGLQYIYALKQLYNANTATFNRLCPSSERHSGTCAERLATEVLNGNPDILLVHKYQYENYVQIQNVDKCV
jgi:hypothetical protein